MKVPHAKRDLTSNAVVFIDHRGFERAKVRRQRAAAIDAQTQEVASLNAKIDRLTAVVERLLARDK